MIDHREVREKEVSKYVLESNLEFWTKKSGLNPVDNWEALKDFKRKE